MPPHTSRMFPETPREPVAAELAAVYVVIVNYRTGPLVVECLSSLVSQQADLRGGKVIVADNASGDGSVELVDGAIDRNGWRGWAEVLALPENGGFAYGNNRGIRRAHEHDPKLGTIICLNPDTTVHAGALAALVAHLERQPGAGVAGASIEDEHGVLQRTAHPFHSPWSELDSGAQLAAITRLVGDRSLAPAPASEPIECDWVSGACFAVRAQVLASVGLLDEGYFLYFEETDFCLRARRAGWSCWYVPGARVRHFEGASTGIRQPRRRRAAYWFASRRRFLARAHGLSGLIAADTLWALGRASLVVRRWLRLGGATQARSEPARFAYDLLVGDARAILRGELRGLQVIDRSGR